MNRPVKTIATLGAALALGAGGGAGAYALLDSPSPAAAPAPVTVTAPAARPAAAQASTLTVNQIYRQDGPGVVDIVVTNGSGQAQQPFPFGGQRSSRAEGSGFVFDDAGHVVTNQHVVAGGGTVKVTLANGKTYSAKVVGTDSSTDIAVLKVDAPGSALRPLPIGDSSDLEVGDGVVAIGSPFGLEQTVTSGIVSALDRQIKAPNNYQISGAIQTDAAINHGNSGGPLIAMNGKVVGVNAQIESDSGDNAGVGFAIPSNTVKSVASQLIAGGKVQHAYLGVSIADAPGGGVAVQEVKPDTPAAAAGLKNGDVITALDGKRTDTTADLGGAVDSHRPGDKVSVTFRRNDETKTVTVTLGTRPA